MAVFVPKFLRQLRDVVAASPADDDELRVEETTIDDPADKRSDADKAAELVSEWRLRFPEEEAAPAVFYDPDSGAKLTAKQAQKAFTDAQPSEEATQ